MRFYFILVIVMIFCFKIEAQKDYAKELQSAKWYQDNSLSKKTESKIMVFKKIKDKVPVKERTIFYADGKVKRCFYENETNEFTNENACDSSFTYQVKKDLIHISDHGLMHLYYKMKTIENGLELKPIEPESFYKK